jgi:hypothetical protein
VKRVAPFVALILVLGRAASAIAADPRYPDWPCNQIKVPELSVAAIWTGPPIDDVGDTWERDPQIKDLVVRLAARRTPLDDAEKTIGDFLAASAQDKQTRAKLLFAGLFATLNRERTVVMNGIERFAQRRALVADRIKSEARQMRELQDAPNRDESKVNELTNSIEWDTRVFEDQRKTISYVCEVPIIIERRLGALARAIQQSIE